MRSLSIKIVIVFGISEQLKQLANKENVTLSDAHGEGVIDKETLALAIKAAAHVSHITTQGLTQKGIKCSLSNAVRATEVGIVGGEDQVNRGKVDKIDIDFICHQLKEAILPVFSPLAFSRSGDSLRINSDDLAAELAIGLNASKLIYLSLHPGITINGIFIRNITFDDIQKTYDEDPQSIDEDIRSKTYNLVKAIARGVPRAHIIDGRLYDGLLTEVFSSEGIGTMIHGNEYQQIRKAVDTDAQIIYNITKTAAKDEILKPRTHDSIMDEINSFYVLVIDESIVACSCLVDYPDDAVMELAAVYVLPFYQGKGAGKKMVDFACSEAIRLGREKIIALTTQSFSFFYEICGFSEGTKKDLPELRLKTLLESNRNSKILFKNIK